MLHGRIVSEDGRVVVANAHRTTWFWERMRGLLGTRSLPVGTGLLIDPCAAVHTIGMRYSLDLIFLDRHGVVVRVCRNVQPGRFSVGDMHARMTLEVAASWLPAGVAVGKQLLFREDDSSR